MGVLGELFGLVKQTAREVKAEFEDSVISAEHGGRAEALKKNVSKKRASIYF